MVKRKPTGNSKTALPTHLTAIPILNMAKAPFTTIGAFSVSTIRPTDVGILTQDRYSAALSDAQCTAFYSLSDGTAASSIKLGRAIRYALGCVAINGPPSIALAVVRKEPEDPQPRIHELPYAQDAIWLSRDDYGVKPGTTATEIDELVTVFLEGSDRHPRVALAADRLYTAMLRSSPTDTIVDLAIALESFTDSNTEVSFKCALYNSITSSSDSSERKSAFDLIRKLYNIRSKVVHGSGTSTEALSQEETLEIAKLVRLQILYLCSNFKDSTADQWREHLLDLALGRSVPLTRPQHTSTTGSQVGEGTDGDASIQEEEGQKKKANNARRDRGRKVK
ncbi:MAG: hypothetical protein AB7F89_18050 [Pirellulaceae bacterium]